MQEYDQDNETLEQYEFKRWLNEPMTLWYFTHLLESFNFLNTLAAAEIGNSVDRYKGQAEVLAYVVDPMSLFRQYRGDR